MSFSRIPNSFKLAVLQESPNESAGETKQSTTNYSSHLSNFSSENWNMIIMGGLALFLIIIIRRVFKR